MSANPFAAVPPGGPRMIRRFVSTLALAVVFCSAHAFTQSTTGTISGVVTDSTGAILPGVTVDAKHTEMGGVRSMVTDAEGRYRASNLAVGDYVVTATMAGFQPMVRS